jgi:leader peptidase (prepilin peptidase)/N-methyltransferase
MAPSVVSMVRVRVSIGLSRCPVGRCASSTLRVVDALFVAACGVAGVAAGAVLDPVSQKLADRSRAAEERARAGREATREAVSPDGSGDTGPRTVPELATEAPTAEPELVPDATAAVPASEETPDARSEVRHLLPSGRSTGRTVGAAIATGVLWAAMAHHFGVHLVVVPYLVFVAMAVAVSVTDLSHRLVPRNLIYGALALIVPLLLAVSAVDHTWSFLVRAVVWGAVAFAVFFLIWFLVPRGMGFGDVRLAGVIGLTVGYLGPVHVYLAFLCGFVLGLLFGLMLMVGSSAGRKTRIPFAPALAAGATIAILWGGTLGQHLFRTGS